MTHLSSQQLSAHLDSALLGASLQAVETHLEACERCRDELAALTLQDQMLTEALRGETDRELFDLIGLRVQSVVHPQRARALEKSISELERVRGERRRQAELVARRVTEQRQQAPAAEARMNPLPEPAAPAESAHASAPAIVPVNPSKPPVLPTPPRPPVLSTPPVLPTPPRPPVLSTPSVPPKAPALPTPPAPEPAPAPEPEAQANPAGELRRRALDQARARAEAEARAFALESERAREEAERRVLEQAVARARYEVAARRRAKEEGRTRAVNSARAEALRLAHAAEAALAAAETSARDALAAKARAETRAAAAEEARRQARRKAEEARRLEAELAEPAESGKRAAPDSPQASLEPATLSGEEVAAMRDWPLEADAEEPAPRPARSRRPRAMLREHAGARPSPVLTLVAAVVILLAAIWFAIGRQWVHAPQDRLPAASAVETPAPADAGIAPPPAAPVAPEPAALSAPSAPVTHSDDTRKPHRATETPRHGDTAPVEATSGSGQATVLEETHTSSVAEAEPDDETPVDLGLLCGTVRDDEHHPIAGARVMMADVGVVVVTDRVGRFCLTAPRGVRTLSVIALGFGTHRETVSVGRRTSELSVTLRTASPAPRASAR